MTTPMKAIFACFFCALFCAALPACHREDSPAQRVAAKLQRGLTGDGTLYQPDHSNDPIVRETFRVGY
jgi:hypothetical protein